MKKIAAFMFLVASLAGCVSGPVRVGPPGQVREAPDAQPVHPAQTEPAFCVASISGQWGALTNPMSVGPLLNSARLRRLRVLARDNFISDGCDVLLVMIERGISIWGNCAIKAYSAFTKEVLWEGSANGKNFSDTTGYQRLAPHLQLAFQPGQPAYEKLMAGKADKGSPTIEDVEDIAGRLQTSAELGKGMLDIDFVAEARPAARERLIPAQNTATPNPPVAAQSAPHSDVDEPPTARAPRPNAHAVVIGVGKYRQKLPPADFADSDARLVARYLRAMGFQDANIATLVNEEATKGDFEKYFEQWLPNRVDQSAEVFVYYSGHGAPNPTTGDAYLVPYDGDPTYLKQTGYPLKSLYGALARLPTDNVTVVLDSCFSGAGGRSVIAKGARPLVNIALDQDVPRRIRILTASAADQISHSYDEQGHGLFTYFLLKGIQKQPGEGALGIKSAFDFAAPQVSNIARREYNSDQTPQWRERR